MGSNFAFVSRLVCFFRSNSGSSKSAAPPETFEMLRESLESKEKAENILMDFYTNSNWSIIRPGGLISEPKTGTAILTEDVMAIGGIHREDLAELVVKAMDSPQTERKVLTAVDPALGNQFAETKKEFEAFVL